jgi:hypothetical protein
METSHKLHTWIILLLFWNAALLMLILGLLYFRPTIAPSTGSIASECGAATLEALKNTCANI